MTNEEFLRALPSEERNRNFWTQSMARRLEGETFPAPKPYGGSPASIHLKKMKSK